MTEETQLVVRSKQDAQLRQILRPVLEKECKRRGIVCPRRNTEEEMLALYCLAQSFPIESTESEMATHQIDRMLLPKKLEALIEANIPRRGIWFERARHRVGLLAGIAVSGIMGAILYAIKALLVALVIFFSEIPIVALPFFFVGIGVFILYMRANASQFTPLQAAAIWGTVAAVTAFVAYAGFLAAMRHRASKASGADGDAPRTVVIRRAGEE